MVANTVGFEPGAGCVTGRSSNFFTAANFMTAFKSKVVNYNQQQPYIEGPKSLQNLTLPLYQCPDIAEEHIREDALQQSMPAY